MQWDGRNTLKMCSTNQFVVYRAYLNVRWLFALGIFTGYCLDMKELHLNGHSCPDLKITR